MRWLILAAAVLYALVLFVAWSLCRVAALADDAMFDAEPDRAERCPLCTSPNVHVAADRRRMCRSCLAVYPLSNVIEEP